MMDVILAASEVIICALIALALTEFMFSSLRRMGVIKTIPVPTQPASKPDPFHAGDMVVLKPDHNPYNGYLKCTVPYLVLKAAYSTHLIRLRIDNGAEGWFDSAHFEKYDGIGRTMPIDLSGEYDEAIRAQEIMEDVSNR